MGLGISTEKRGFYDNSFRVKIVSTPPCKNRKQKVDSSLSNRLLLWAPPQVERGGCMQGNGLEKVSRHITHSQVRFRHPFGSPRMVKSKRTEHGAERGLWDGEAHRHYRENFLGQWQPLLTCCRSPAMSASRRLRFFLFSSSPGRTTSLPTSPWPHVHPPPRVPCASNSVDMAWFAQTAGRNVLRARVFPFMQHPALG